MEKENCKCDSCPRNQPIDINILTGKIAKEIISQIHELGTKQTNKCQKCGNEMVRDGDTILLSLPAQYPFKCEKCGYKKNFM